MIILEKYVFICLVCLQNNNPVKLNSLIRDINILIFKYYVDRIICRLCYLPSVDNSEILNLVWNYIPTDGNAGNYVRRYK